MNVLMFAAKVDKILVSRLGYSRSQQSQVQKAVADQMISDHFNAGSTVSETVEIVQQVLKTLEG